MAGWEDAPIVDAPSWEDAPTVEEPPARTKSESVFRGLGLGTRYLTETPALTLAGLGDLAVKALNKGIDAFDVVGQAIGDKPLTYRFPEPGGAQRVYGAFSQMGFPEPESEMDVLGERMARTGTTAMVAPALGTRMAASPRPTTAGVGETLARSPGSQVVASQTGAAGGHYAAEAGAGPYTEALAEMSAGAVPAIMRTGPAAATRGAVRGGEAGRQQVERSVADFQRVGTEPSVGQATGGRMAQATEGGLSRYPGGAGRMERAATAQADEIAAGLEARATQLAGRSSAQRAGQAIERGVRGEGGFVDRFRIRQRQLEDNLEQLVPENTRVEPTNTRQTLARMLGDTQGAEETARAISNPRVRAIDDALFEDTMRDGTLPFRALRQLRTSVGERLEDAGLADDVSRSEWRRIYAALSRDMEAAVNATGDPQAMQAWRRANNYTRSGHARLETIDAVLRKKGGPEKIFNAAMAGTKDGDTVIRAVMQSLDPEQQRMVTATVLRRLGMATPGAQNELGSRFSTETLLTNWNRLSPEAKRTLFDRHGPTFRDDMDAIARVAGNLREGSQVFRNPSGTAQASAQMATVTSFAVALATGHFKTAATIAGVSGAANAAARVMTNPRFVHWLAQNTETPIEQLPVQVNLLIQQATDSGDQDLAYAAALLEQSLSR